MRASRAFFAIALACSAAACSRGDAASAPAPAATPAPAPSSAPSSAPLTAAAPAPSTARAPAAEYTVPLSAKPIGHTSLVLKLRFANDKLAAFKPRSKLPLGTERYKAEIAAYRVAQALGLSNVPVAMAAAFPASTLRPLLTTRGEDLAPDPDGVVRGALMPWIKYDVWPLEREPLRSQYDRYLTTSAEIPDSDKKRARQVSTLVVFDYLTANWDRWSGGNVALDADSDTVLFVDNDGAFYDAPDPTNLADQLAHVRRLKRFSRAFVSALRALTLQKLEAAVGEETKGIPLLPKRVLEAADERRARALKAVDAKIAEAGEANVLAFE